jgi:hypothetical protein
MSGVPFVTTQVWSFNPSLARTSVVKEIGPIPRNLHNDTCPERYVCRRYDELYKEKGSYIFGKIGDDATVKDIGRTRGKQYFMRLKKASRMILSH